MQMYCIYLNINLFCIIISKGGIENGKDGPTSQAYSNSEELQETQKKTVSKQVLIYHNIHS